MFKKELAVFGVFILAFCAGLSALSSTGSAQSVEVKTYGGVSYISGGIGLDEREELEMVGRNYNLKLVFAVQQGNFLSDVQVAITGSGGNTVLEAVSDGPWFYVQLPPGTYNVSATTLGKTFRKTARVGSGARTQLSFVWSG